MQRPAYILPVIIFSQFTGTSLWFSGNAVLLDLQRDWGLSAHATGYTTSAVQLGFVSGTLLFAFFVIADRFSPRLVFFCCSLAGALANAALLIAPEGLAWLLLLRFATGFFLAGIYPVGMRIAAGWYAEGLGRALGYLVGALILGTAFPHLLRASGTEFPWQQVLGWVSLLAAGGGLAMLLLVPDGPHLPHGTRFDPRALLIVFRSAKFRASAFGYFGHMWELYTLWAFIPTLLIAYAAAQDIDLNVSLWSFAAIAVGALACAGGGILSTRIGSAPVAASLLAISGMCCLLSPFLFTASPPLFLAFLLLWGLSVSSDSPQFSALNAANAPREFVGSALTIVNSIGFLITVVSIQLADLLLTLIETRYLFWLLVPGPVLGLLAFRPLLGEHRAAARQ
ncbi:MAG TPA: MFS transporter [Gammaproteobacteria bacterium]|jgi:MFS family permease